MIPKLIHFCWYGGGKYNEVIEKCMASWKNKLPDYEIMRWDESNTPFQNMPFLKILYKQKRWAFISDYIRLYALYKYGGIYFDTDIEVIKPFDDLLNEKAFIGFQVDHDSAKYPFNTAVIGCVKGNKFIEYCLQETEKLQRMHYHAMAAPSISSKILTKRFGVKEHKIYHLESVTVYTKDYFYPFSWLEKFSPSCLTNNTRTIHWWEDSWGKRKKNLSYYWTSLTRKIERTPNIFLSRIQYVFQKKGNFFLYRK